MNIEREQERKARISEQEARAKTEKELKVKLAAVKSKLFALFAEPDAHKRGKALEAVLNGSFRCIRYPSARGISRSAGHVAAV